MNITPVRTPLLIKSLFSNLVWDIKTQEKVIYLSFDDGPTPEITEWTLNQLAQFNAKASFFCIGKNVARYPDIFNAIVAQGHAIGNHTYNHIKGWKNTTKVYLDNIKQCEAVFNAHLDRNLDASTDTKLFRPPYGQIKPKQWQQLIAQGYKVIMWDVLSIDWSAKLSQENCLKNVITHTNAGSIVVFHDSEKAAKNMQYALPKVLEHFSNMGYVFKRIPG